MGLQEQKPVPLVPVEITQVIGEPNVKSTQQNF